MQYHKIQTVFKRDPASNHKNLLIGQYSLPEFEYLANNEWIFTEKVDGTNIRVMWDGKFITYGGKTDNAQIPAKLINALNDQFGDMEEAFASVFPDSTPESQVILYGEGFGAGIQKGGGNYRSNQGFVLFDVKIGPWWLKRDDVINIAIKLMIFEVVPVVGIGTLADMVDIAQAGFLSRWGEFDAEGIVARPTVELADRAGRRIITKIKLKDFK